MTELVSQKLTLKTKADFQFSLFRLAIKPIYFDLRKSKLDHSVFCKLPYLHKLESCLDAVNEIRKQFF